MIKQILYILENFEQCLGVVSITEIKMMKTGPDFVVHVTQNSRSRGRQISREFKANLVYIESFRTVRDTQNNPVSKKKKKLQRYSNWCVLLSSYHHEMKFIIWNTCGPVVNIPVIARLVNQAIIEVQLLLCHVVQIFFRKEAKNEKENEADMTALLKRSDTRVLFPTT